MRLANSCGLWLIPARQRTNMVENQVLTSDVTDRRILQAMGALPRERFVPAAWGALAYMDEAVPLSVSGRMLMAPRVFAQASLPFSPTWHEVQQVLTLTTGDQPADIRDQFFLNVQFTGCRALSTITGCLNQGDPQRQIHLPNQVGQEHQAPGKNPDNSKGSSVRVIHRN